MKPAKLKNSVLPMVHSFRLGFGRVPSCFIGIGGTLLLLSGCTTSMVTSKLAKPEGNKHIEGQIYYLPRIDYMVSVDRELKSCSTSFKSDEEAILSWLYLAVASPVKKTTVIEEAQSLYNSAMEAPILEIPHVKVFLESDSVLGPNWMEKFKPKDITTKDDLYKHLEKITTNRFDIRPHIKLDVLMRASATPLVSPDPNHAYVIDYPKMQSELKGTDYLVETYPNGTLKSINVTIDDQTGSFIKDTLNGVAKLAAASAGFPIPTPSATKAKLVLMLKKIPFQSFDIWKNGVLKTPCNAVTQSRLIHRKELIEQVEVGEENNLKHLKVSNRHANDLAQAVVERDKKKAVLDDMKADDPDRPNAVSDLDAAEKNVKIARKALAKAREEQGEELAKSNETAAKLSAIRKELTLTKVTTITPEQKAEPAKPKQKTELVYDLKGQDEARAAWVDDKRVDEICDAMSNTNDKQKCRKNIVVQLNDQLKAQAAIYPLLTKIEPGSVTKADGVFYRQPLSTTLWVCKEEDCLDIDKRPKALPRNILLSTPVVIPQLGTLGTLPLKNTPFQNNSIGASFAETGALTKLTYKTNAAAAKAASVFDQSSSTVLEYTEAKRNQETVKLEQSKSELEAQKALLNAQLELEKKRDELDKYRDEKSSSGE